MQTRALNSSLWELLSHTSHYHAPVSTMCKIFSEAFTKPGYAMEDFLDHTYNTVCSFPLLLLGHVTSNAHGFSKQLFETEINRKIKREPALAVGPRSKVFPDGEAPAVIAVEEEGSLVGGVTQQDFVRELWAF